MTRLGTVALQTRNQEEEDCAKVVNTYNTGTGT